MKYFPSFSLCRYDYNMLKCRCESFRDSRYERNFGAKSYNSRVTHIEVFLAFKSRPHRGSVKHRPGICNSMIRNSFEWFNVDSDGRHVVEGTSGPMFPAAAVALITLLSRS